MNTKIKVWSQIGNTPLSDRKGAYCDELLSIEVQCDNPEQARAKCLAAIKGTKHAVRGYYEMPQWWNQNTRSGWV